MAYCYMLHTGTKQTLNCFPKWGFKKIFFTPAVAECLRGMCWGGGGGGTQKMLSAYSKREPSRVCKLLVKTSRQSPASHWMPRPSALSRGSSRVTSPAWEQISISKPTAFPRSWVARNPLGRTGGKGGKSDGSKITGQVGLVGGQPTIQWIKFMCPVGRKRWRGEPLWSLGRLWIGCSLQNVFLSQQKAFTLALKCLLKPSGLSSSSWLLGRSKSSFWFFHAIFLTNLNDLIGPPNIMWRKSIQVSLFEWEGSY